jgi:hypothetical protein
MKQRIITLIGITALALTVATAASSMTSTATVSAGSLSANTASAPSTSVTLDGTDKTASLPVAVSVVDATGSGSGWNVTEAATTFVSGTHSFAAPTATTTSSACATGGNSCTNATNSITGYPITLSTSATKIFNAALNTGMGKLDLTSGIAVAIPGNAFAGTYTSTVTISIVSGP